MANSNEIESKTEMITVIGYDALNLASLRVDSDDHEFSFGCLCRSINRQCFDNIPFWAIKTGLNKIGSVVLYQSHPISKT
jgi:hypothetical protein